MRQIHVGPHVQRLLRRCLCTTPPQQQQADMLATSAPTVEAPNPLSLALGRMHIVRAGQLPAPQQTQLARLTHMLGAATKSSSQGVKPLPSSSIHINNNSKNDKVFVACSVQCDSPLPCSSSTSFTSCDVPRGQYAPDCCSGPSFVGVNYAYHSRVNKHGGTLQGILKGCAEQNALGAVAAGGVPYANVSRVYLACSSSATDSVCAGRAGLCGSRGAFFPCPECWRHLVRVAQMRQDAQEEAADLLQLYVWAGGMDVALHAMSIAQDRMESAAGAVDVTLVIH